MVDRRSRAYFAVFLLVLAPVAAVVLLTVLLLFGVEPRIVFAPGRAVQSLFRFFGFPVANRVAVASTGLFWWAIIAGVGVAWEKRRGRS